jgi:hypothetical protein
MFFNETGLNVWELLESHILLIINYLKFYQLKLELSLNMINTPARLLHK